MRWKVVFAKHAMKDASKLAAAGLKPKAQGVRPAPATPSQSTMNSVAPFAVEDRCASAPSATW